MLTALTGATGFLGLHLLGDVIDRRGTVVVLARGGRAATLRLADLWHGAGDTTMDSGLDRLRLVNIGGTCHTPVLAAAGRRHPALVHVSAAFVADRRRVGTVYGLDDSPGVETPNERSAHEGEVVVGRSAADTGHPVTVLLPSILTTDLPPGPAVPSHPMRFAARALSQPNVGPVPGTPAYPHHRRRRDDARVRAKVTVPSTVDQVGVGLAAGAVEGARR